MTYTIDVRVTSTASPEVIFEHIARAEAWGVWGRFPSKAQRERRGFGTPDGVGSIRRIWPAREETIAYDPPRHYAYRALSGLPIDDYRADVHLEPRTEGGTSIRWQGRFDAKIPGTGPLMHFAFKRVVAGLAKKVSEHAEHCPPTCPAHKAVTPRGA